MVKTRRKRRRNVRKTRLRKRKSVRNNKKTRRLRGGRSKGYGLPEGQKSGRMFRQPVFCDEQVDPLACHEYTGCKWGKAKGLSGYTPGGRVMRCRGEKNVLDEDNGTGVISASEQQGGPVAASGQGGLNNTLLRMGVSQ